MIPAMEKAAEVLKIFEEVLPDLVWKDTPPASEQVESVMEQYNCQFFQGTSKLGQKKHPWFVTLTVYTVPAHEAVSEIDDGMRYDGAVAVDGTIVRLPFELAKKAAEYAEKAVG